MKRPLIFITYILPIIFLISCQSDNDNLISDNDYIEIADESGKVPSLRPIEPSHTDHLVSSFIMVLREHGIVIKCNDIDELATIISEIPSQEFMRVSEELEYEFYAKYDDVNLDVEISDEEFSDYLLNNYSSEFRDLYYQSMKPELSELKLIENSNIFKVNIEFIQVSQVYDLRG